jgi:hypothetical protein
MMTKYIDDIFTWMESGDVVDENLEYERIVRDKDRQQMLLKLKRNMMKSSRSISG